VCQRQNKEQKVKELLSETLVPFQEEKCRHFLHEKVAQIFAKKS
jgi:hypothetical protein